MLLVLPLPHRGYLCNTCPQLLTDPDFTLGTSKLRHKRGAEPLGSSDLCRSHPSRCTCFGFLVFPSGKWDGKEEG